MSFDYAQDEACLVMDTHLILSEVEGYCRNPGSGPTVFPDERHEGNSMTIWIWIMAAAINGLLAVTAGAAASHLFAADAHRIALMSTAAQYAMYHALALIALAALAGKEAGRMKRFLTAAGWLFLAGTILFSGSLYLLALTGTPVFARVTPIGGLAFMLGWVSLGIFAGRRLWVSQRE
jgi:uncharacterized membrane protein YgdD (TMEM256/DUF423 family)